MRKDRKDKSGEGSGDSKSGRERGGKMRGWEDGNGRERLMTVEARDRGEREEEVEKEVSEQTAVTCDQKDSSLLTSFNWKSVYFLHARHHNNASALSCKGYWWFVVKLT